MYRHGFRAKQLALVDERVTLSPTERRILLVRYGFEWQRALPGGRLARSVVVESFKAHRSPPLRCEGAGVDLERTLVWQHFARNRRIAAWAKRNLHRRPIVLAASVEHAAELASHLPAWQLLTGEQPDTRGLLPRHIHYLKERTVQRHTGPAIVTTAGLAAVQWQEVDVLVRADAGAGLVTLPEAAFYLTTRRLPLTVVDVDDRMMSPVLAKRCQRRWAAYREAEWFRAGVDPVTARMNAFIQERQA